VLYSFLNPPAGFGAPLQTPYRKNQSNGLKGKNNDCSEIKIAHRSALPENGTLAEMP
jgi:hypothetical protein